MSVDYRKPLTDAGHEAMAREIAITHPMTQVYARLLVDAAEADARVVRLMLVLGVDPVRQWRTNVRALIAKGEM